MAGVASGSRAMSFMLPTSARCPSFARWSRSWGLGWGLAQPLARLLARAACAASFALVARAPPGAADARVRIVALGDSLTAGFGLAGEAAFPTRLQAALRAKGLAVEISNAGVSGDTSSSGLARPRRA